MLIVAVCVFGFFCQIHCDEVVSATSRV